MSDQTMLIFLVNVIICAKTQVVRRFLKMSLTILKIAANTSASLNGWWLHLEYKEFAISFSYKSHQRLISTLQ